MKTIILSLILTVVFGSVMIAEAQTKPAMKVRVGKKVKDSKSKITVKFDSVTEDSRCAEGAQCVWAGNAKVKVTVSQPGVEPFTFEANTNLGAKGETYNGYAIYLDELSPASKSGRKTNYTATFSISRMTR